MSSIAVIESTNVEEWINESHGKLTLQQVCLKFGLDIENDHVNKIFWDIKSKSQILINEDMLNYMGYSGNFKDKNGSFKKTLKKMQNIKYTEEVDAKDPRKKYAVLRGFDFETVLMHMRTSKSSEIFTLLSTMKMCVIKYREYEKLYANRLADISTRQKNDVMDKLEQMTKKFDLSMQQAAQDRKDIEEKASRERKQITQQLERNVSILNNVIAPKITPDPINSGKNHILAIYSTIVPGEWYMMRRQREGWTEAERKLMKRNMTLLHRWDNVPHAVDVGNMIKKHCRKYLSWDAYGNKIKAKHTNANNITDQHLLEIIEKILSRKNCAHKLADENDNVLASS